MFLNSGLDGIVAVSQSELIRTSPGEGFTGMLERSRSPVGGTEGIPSSSSDMVLLLMARGTRRAWEAFHKGVTSERGAELP